MEESREDRMRSRMRGAARHQVSDADFGTLFTIPTIAPEAAPEPSSGSSDPPVQASQAPTPAQAAAKRTSPNTSAKRRRLDPGSATAAASEPAQQPVQPRSANRSLRRRPQPPASSDPYDQDNAPSPSNILRSTPRSRASVRQPSRELGSSGGPKPATQNVAPTHSSPPLPHLPTDEVSESPANEPGSGHRRRVRGAEARDSSAILQSALRTVDSDPADGYMQSSSPLTRLSRKSIAAGDLASAKSTRTGLRRSTRLSGSPDDDVNESASDPPAEPVDETVAEEPEPAADLSEEVNFQEIAETVIEEPEAAGSPEVDVAREIDDREAAGRLGRKRTRRSIPAPSPELASEEPEPEAAPVAKRPRKEKEAAPKKQKKKNEKASPAKQRQPKAPRAKQTKPASRRKSKNGDEDEEGDDHTGRSALSIKVQRFTNGIRGDEDSDEEDVLATMILPSDRREPNAADVLSYICERVIGRALENFKQAFSETQDRPTKKELGVKIKALGEFQQELRTRLLEHRIALDTLHSLKQRVKKAHKEKLQLRQRLREIRTEREHVALRMDAVRAKHEEDSKEALHNISLSSAMHDIDLAIEQGRAAPEISGKEARMADLENLELLISRVTEQACGDAGTLGQIKGFNAFLERAMAVL